MPLKKEYIHLMVDGMAHAGFVFLVATGFLMRYGHNTAIWELDRHDGCTSCLLLCHHKLFLSASVGPVVYLRHQARHSWILNNHDLRGSGAQSFC